MENKPEIRQFDFGDGDVSLLAEFSVAPFGTAPIATDDTSAESRRILEVLIDGWDDLWPEMLEKLQDSMESYGVEQKLGRDDFQGSISPMDPSCYMGDRSDYFLSLQFDEPPLWDFFLKGTKIVHFQPVF
jgi:hypothetical protein